MSLLFSKLGFIHRRLWERDGFYRVALFFGPAPLLGAALAAAVWNYIIPGPNVQHQPPAWAHYEKQTNENNGSPDAPLPANPTKPLPPLRADGSAIGYDSGWSMTANALTLDAAMETNISPVPITGFTIDEPAVNMAQMLAERPKDQLFIGISSAFLVIRKAGTYGIFPRFERRAGPLANCLVRFLVNGHRTISAVLLNVAQETTRDFPSAWLELRPGLYKIEWAFGCWHDNEMSDLGQISVMLVEPDSHTARPLRATDIVR
jgi:hypothetical protein